MKILVANTQLSYVGGMETYLGSFVPAMVERGHQVRVAAEHGVEPRAQRSWCPVDVTVLTIREALARRAAWVPDVILCNPLSDPSMERDLANLAPLVFFAHTFYGTCVSGTKMHAFPNAIPCARSFGFACLALYYPRRCGGLSPVKAVTLFAAERGRREFLTTARHILVGSHYMRSELTKNGIDPKHVTVVGFPAETTAIQRDCEYLPGRIVYVGRLTRVKGVGLLVRALSLLPRGSFTSLVVAGDGLERSRLTNLASRLGVATEFRGWLTAAETREVIASSACLALPSVWPEPFGLVGLEAVASSVPVAAFDLGGVREWLIPGLTGELAPAVPPTAAGLAGALQRALALRNGWETTREARTHQLEKFNPRMHFDHVERLLVRSQT